MTDAFSRSYRLSLGRSTVRGLGTRVFKCDFDLRAGVGERGNSIGGPYPGFESGAKGQLACWATPSALLATCAFSDRATGVPDLSQGFFHAIGPCLRAAARRQQHGGLLRLWLRVAERRRQEGGVMLRSQAATEMVGVTTAAPRAFCGGRFSGRGRHHNTAFGSPDQSPRC